MKSNRYSGDGSFFLRGAQNWWYFMPISVWQWAALMSDGPYNLCTQHSAWGSWISRLEHTAKLICFVRDGRRGEGRLLSFRQERSTWCQERRRCSFCCNPTAVQAPSPPIDGAPAALLCLLHIAPALPRQPTSCWTNATLSLCHFLLSARSSVKGKAFRGF